MKNQSPAPSLVPPVSWLGSGSSRFRDPGLRYLLLITLLGILVRAYGLTSQSLWVDELMSWNHIRPGAGLDFFEQIRDAIQGPLYLAITWPLLRLQDSALSLRLVSLVAGCLTVPALAVFSGRLFGRNVARLAGLLLALSPFHIWYSQEGRGYALLMFFAVAMGLVLLRILEEGPRPGPALLFTLCSACAVWSNMSGLFLWAGMGLTMLLVRPPRSRSQLAWWGIAFGGGLLAVLPWILKAAGIWAVDRMVVGNPTGEALRGDSTFDILALPYTLFTFFFGYSYGPSLRELHEADKLGVLRHHLPLLVLAAIPLATGLAAGLLRLRQHGRVLLPWILVPVLVLIFLSVRNVKPWNPRYVAVAFPWLLVLLALGLNHLPGRLRAGLTLLVVLLALFSLGGYYWNASYAKADIRAVAGFLAEREEANNGRPVPILVPAVSSVLAYYHQGRAPLIAAHHAGPWADAREAGEFLDRVIGTRDALYWVRAREWFYDPHGVLPAAFAERGVLDLEYEAAGVQLYLWRAAQADSLQLDLNGP
jgi:hypothetical protein